MCVLLCLYVFVGNGLYGDLLALLFACALACHLLSDASADPPSSYLLPAGHSLETGTEVYHAAHVRNVLADCKIEMSGTPEMQARGGGGSVSLIVVVAAAASV